MNLKKKKRNLVQKLFQVKDKKKEIEISNFSGNNFERVLINYSGDYGDIFQNNFNSLDLDNKWELFKGDKNEAVFDYLAIYPRKDFKVGGNNDEDNFKSDIKVFDKIFKSKWHERLFLKDDLLGFTSMFATSTLLVYSTIQNNEIIDNAINYVLPNLSADLKANISLPFSLFVPFTGLMIPKIFKFGVLNKYAKKLSDDSVNYSIGKDCDIFIEKDNNLRKYEEGLISRREFLFSKKIKSN